MELMSERNGRNPSKRCTEYFFVRNSAWNGQSSRSRVVHVLQNDLVTCYKHRYRGF